jgi:transketolase
VAIGAAIAKKHDHDEHSVFALTGDGELQEGQVWEAFMFAGAKKVDNLIAIIDHNKKQIDGPTDEVLSLGSLKDKLLAFGWLVLEMDGNKMSEVVSTLKKAKSLLHNDKPVVIVMKSEMGMGVDFMMGTHKWHGTPPNAEQTEKALAQLPETSLGDY